MSVLPMTVPRNDTQWKIFFKKLDSHLPINVKDHGALGDGVTDDTTAALLAAADAAAQKRPLYFPAGTYKMTAAIVIANAAATIFGDGIGLSRIKWTSGASTTGISITSNNARHFHQIRDISLTTAKVAAGTAINLDYSGQISGGNTLDRFQLRFMVYRVAICGDSLPDSGDVFTDGWLCGIQSIAAISGAVLDSFILSRAQTAYQPYSGTSGIKLIGNPANGNFANGHPVQFLIENVSIWFCEYGLQVENTEGIVVCNSNVIACEYGLYCHSEYGQPLFFAYGNHCNCNTRGILVSGQYQVDICNNWLYNIQNSTAAGCIEMTGVVNGKVLGNTYQSFASNSNGLILSGNSNNINVSNNTFVQNSTYMVTCIWIVSGSTYCLGNNNQFNGTFTNKVLNSGGATNKVMEIGINY